MDIAVIPARGGSKRLPRKNIRDFCGKPMIAWAIESAFKSGLFQRVVVSTDDPAIAEVANNSGAETPFSRPPELADDHTPTLPVIRHAIQELGNRGVHPNAVCCIYPCTPFLDSLDLVRARALALTPSIKFVYPVSEFAHPSQRALRILKNGKMEFVLPEYELSRTQDLETTYHDAGQFYWGATSAWLREERMHSAGYGIPIPKWRVVDIDDEQDWRRAELLYRTLREHSE